MDWPAKSPDLHLTEGLRRVLGRRAYAHGRQYDIIFALKTCSLEEWANINQSLCYRLTLSMTHRRAAEMKRQV